jgi:hypothetical protein
VNPNLGLTMVHDPLDEWVRIDAGTGLGRTGGGMPYAGLSDAYGVFGIAIQSLIVERRSAR